MPPFCAMLTAMIRLIFKNKKILISAILLIAALSLIAATKKNKPQVLKNQSSIITVKSQAKAEKLYFSGTIDPLSKTPILSPIKGGVTQQFVPYGTLVKKGDKLFAIRSAAQQSDYQSAITNYLKAKQALNKSKDTYINEAKLFNKGLEPRNTYIEDRDQYYLNRLSYTQAKNALRTALKYHHVANIEKLNIDDIDSVNKVLKAGTTDLIIHAPATGIFLFSKDHNSKDSASVKEDDILGYIGNMSGVSINIKIDEFNINRVHEGQKALITSPAFPGETLQGKVIKVNTQASSAASGAQETPTFLATVQVLNLTPAQQKEIHVGMNVKVTLALQSKSKIELPVNALLIKNGKSMVTVIDSKTGKQKTIPVQTGKTTMKSVEITSGLQGGEKVVVPHSAS